MLMFQKEGTTSMQTVVANVLAQIESVVIGKPHQVKLALACLFAKGHIYCYF
jgi:MoxR-like ATPase